MRKLLIFILCSFFLGPSLWSQESLASDPSSVGQADSILSIEVNPKTEQEFIEVNLPFGVGDPWSRDKLDLARKFIKATNRYESFSIDWIEDRRTFKVLANPFLYFEETEWRGDEFRSHSRINSLCINEKESLSLSQERLSELSTCITTKIRGEGYLDAKVIVYSEDSTLIVELNLGEAYRIGEVSFGGAQFFSTGFLLSLIRNRDGSRYRAFSLEADTEEIWNTYVERDFYLVRVAKPIVRIQPATKTVDIEWKITEGPRLNIKFVGGFNSRRFLEQMLSSREPLSDWFLEEIAADIKEYLANEGYLDVEVVEERKKIREGYFRVKLRTKKGRQYRLLEPVWLGVQDEESIEDIYLNGYRLDPGRRFGESAFREEFETRFFTDLAQAGYLNVKVKSLEFNIDRRRHVVQPVISMNEGQRVIIGEVNYEGVRSVFKSSVEMRRLRDLLKVGSPLDPLELDQRKADLVQGMRQIGFLDAKVESTWQAKLESYRINIDINSGPRYIVKNIIIRGLRRTDIEVVSREILIKTDQFYAQIDVQDTVSQILRLGLARSVDIQVFEKNAAEGFLYLIVDVREAARFRFELGPGFGTSDGVRGVFRGTYANIAGTGRRIGLYAKASRELEEAKLPDNVLNDDAEKEPFVERRITLEYFEPYMLSIPVDGRISVTHEREARRQFSVENNSIQTSLDWRINRNWTYSPAYKVEFSDPFNIEVTDTAPVDDSRSNRLHSFNQSLEASYVDDTFSPQKGILASVDFELFDSFLGGNQNFWILSLNQTFYYPLYRVNKDRSFGFALSFNQGFSQAYSSTAEVPVEKRFRVGGETSVRGYSQDAIVPVDDSGEALQNGGLSTFYFRSELNFPVYKNFDLLGFFDGGNIYKTNMDYNLFELRYGAGMGVRFNTPVGPVKFGYAFALFKKENEDLGHIYFGVGPL